MTASVAPRIAALDGVRGIAILLVLLMHGLQPRLMATAMSDVDIAYARVATLGWTGVDLFFVLSGYLITGILVRNKDEPHYFRNFYARRVLRIFPLYYAVVCLLLFVLDRPATTAWEKATYLLYVQNLNYTIAGEQTLDPVRLVTWSLAIEEQFYLLWPAVVFLLTRRGLLRTCVVVIVAVGVARFALVEIGQGLGADAPRVLTYLDWFTPTRVDTLMVGALLALAPRPPAWAGRVAVAGGGVGLYALSAHGWTSTTTTMLQLGLPCAALAAAGTLVLAQGDGLVARACRSRVLGTFGKYSYAIYLLHMLVFEQLAVWLTGDSSPLPLRAWVAACGSHVPVVAFFTAIATAATLLAAIASWHLIEKHFLALKRHFPSAAA